MKTSTISRRRLRARIDMKSYSFRVLIEEDTSATGHRGYFASVPALEHFGAATQGRTPDEALQNMHEVLTLILEELLEEGKAIPTSDVTVSDDPVVTVTV